ncbi:hypothetical protein EDD29_7224 [Actinocorallia herbida]|uniref:Uncharacterized protein n=1 Tax=Actinocorallia herbida TaxID=58109 RepID=A0A3N1D7K6_9ACTN|nr:hypothetical protein EDD29_7224 [Actinocorallia herbida]
MPIGPEVRPTGPPRFACPGGIISTRTSDGPARVAAPRRARGRARPGLRATPIRRPRRTRRAHPMCPTCASALSGGVRPDGSSRGAGQGRPPSGRRAGVPPPDPPCDQNRRGRPEWRRGPLRARPSLTGSGRADEQSGNEDDEVWIISGPFAGEQSGPRCARSGRTDGPLRAGLLDPAPPFRPPARAPPRARRAGRTRRTWTARHTNPSLAHQARPAHDKPIRNNAHTEQAHPSHTKPAPRTTSPSGTTPTPNKPTPPPGRPRPFPTLRLGPRPEAD